MESASNSLLLNSHLFSTGKSYNKNTNRFYYQSQTPTPTNSNLYLVPPFSSVSPRNYNSGKCRRPSGFAASSSLHNPTPSPEFALLLEVDGVLVDAYRSGNQQAFNVAFRKLGLDCANWTQPIYTDLVRKSAGDEERMLILFFNRIGWPTSLPTSEKESFVKGVLQEKKKAFNEYLVSESLPLRPGVEDFVDDAYKQGIPILILTAYSKSGDKVARSVVEKFGHERVSKLKIVGNEEVEQSSYMQLVKGVSSGSDEELYSEARKAVSAEKQRIAEEVASMLKLSVDLDTSSPESLDKVVGALRSGAEYAGKAVDECILIAGSQSGVTGAQRIGMPCVVLRSSLTSRAEFPSANAIMDGFGGADLTISKLHQRQWK